MSFKWQGSGPNNTPAYQISGIPYITGSTGGAENLNSPKIFDFPQVTKSITLSSNTSGKSVYLGITANGFNVAPEHYFEVNGLQSVTFDIRTKRVAIQTDNSAEWSLYAALTPVTASQFPTLTGSNSLYQGVG